MTQAAIKSSNVTGPDPIQWTLLLGHWAIRDQALFPALALAHALDISCHHWQCAGPL